MAQLELDVAARLRAFSLRVALSAERETVALAGPSGAGKTTVLRMVAGLRRPDAGCVAAAGATWFDAAAGIDLAPQARSVGLVPQDHALFPHMTVRANVAFGGAARAGELLERLGIAHLAGERPARLSGGERQRVALARALAREPEVLLLDEPLAALDAHTRRVVRDELAALLAVLAIPALLVTHDARDAAVLADRVAVLVDGEVRQLATPAELMRAPADAFVAAFTGASVLHGTADGTTVLLDGGASVRVAQPARGPVALALQPWDVALAAAPPGDGRNALAGIVGAAGPEGIRVGALVAELPRGGALPQRGTPAWAVFAPEAARVVAP